MYLTAVSQIVSRLTSNWTTTDIITDNVNYTPVAGTSFIFCSVDFMDSFPASIGSPQVTGALYRGLGNIEIDIYTPVNEGVGLGASYASTISAIFRGQTFSNIVCFSPTVISGREVGFLTGNWWQTPLICSFECNKTF